MKPIKESEVEFSITVEPEYMTSPREMFPEPCDVELCEKIIKDAEWNEWAWCTVAVKASFKDGAITAEDYLGCCSYEDEADFKAGGYYEDMRQQALKELNVKAEALYAALSNR